MEKVFSALEEITEINNTYQISNNSVSELQGEIESGKVCTPIIGKFSSGKSALVNSLLGYSNKILREDITPETAIPAEIVYTDSEDIITITKNNGELEQLSVDQYRNYTADANTVKSARIQLRNDFLQEIPDVMLVDMPGFESGFEIHNKAIDNYVSQSLAYIVAFPADDLVVRSSVGNILKELCLHDMPLCVVITKYDKRNEEEFEAALEKMKNSLKRYVGDREISFCTTSSFNGDTEELKNFLAEIQEQSQNILAAKYSKKALAIVENTENYLRTTLKNSQLSESDLAEQDEKLHKQFSSLESNFSNEQQNFNSEIAGCVREIKGDVDRALKGELETLVTMVLNKQDIKDYLNNVIRNAVAVSVQKRFIPKVEKHLKRISKSFNDVSIDDVHISFFFDESKLKKRIVSNVVAVSSAFLLGGPIIAVIAGFFMKLWGNKKREELKQEIRMKLQTETFPSIINEVGVSIEMAITKQTTLVNTAIENELKSQKETLEKAMADVRNRMNDEKINKENLISGINIDLERIETLKDELR